MTAFLYLQKFDNSMPVAMPFQPLMDILSRYGVQGRGRGDIEFTLPPDMIAAGCTVIGDFESGVSCVGFDRPLFDADLRCVVWECMERFSCAVFDDTLDTVCTTLSGISALPPNLAAASTVGVRQISSAQQLWPGEFEVWVQGPPRPVLRYTNANTNGPNLQFVDYAVFDKNELYIELNIRPEACNPGTLRVLRNLELRVDAAISVNPEYFILYRYAHSDSSLAVLESPRLGEMANRATIISPSPIFMEPRIKSPFIADRQIFVNERICAMKLTRHMHENYQLALDGSIGSIDTLARFLDALHTAYCQERDTQPPEQAYTSQLAIDWAIRAGGYLGTVILQQIGAQYGYVTRGQQRLLVVRTHRGNLYNPNLLVLDHIINGPRNSIADFFQQLIKSDISAIPREDDLVCNIPGFCQILLGQSQFNSGGGLPMEPMIPRDKLDFTVNSLHFLDLYLAEIPRQSADFSDLTLSNLMLAAGAYLGEVIRSNAAEKGCWQWVTYDDYVRDNPGFSQQRPRDVGFLAFLDSAEHTTYPFAYIAMLLSGANMDSTHAYALEFLGSASVGSGSGLSLDSIDIQQSIASLPADQHSYPNITAPAWVAYDPLAKLFKDFSILLEHGKPVWAHIVQANTGIFEAGEAGLPGEIVYDPQGALSPEALAPIAASLLELRKRQAELDPYDPDQAALHAIAEHLNAETTRAFGMSVPPQISTQALLISTMFFERKHLPGGTLVLPYFPVLISEKCPGSAMVLPGKWWPQALLDRVEKRLNEKRLAVWEAAWQKLKDGRTAEEGEYFRCRIKTLERYAHFGGDGQRAIDLVQIGMVPFRVDTNPPPFEWEWDLVSELQSYGECLLTEVEIDRARGLPLNVPRARQSFVVRYLAQMIALHRLLLCDERRLSNEPFKIDPDEIQYSALGLAAGVEDAALQSARLLCLAWQHPDMYTDFIRPEVRVCFMLFAAYLGIQIPALKPFKPMPHLDALIENERWRIADGDELRLLLEAACEEHTRSAPSGPFQGLPAAILLVLKLREMAGLANPQPAHPLFAKPLVIPGKVTFEVACDDLLTRVHDRMTRNGFREDTIEQAIVTQSPLVVDSRVGAMPLRPDLYQPRVQFVPKEEARYTDRLVDGIAVFFGFLPRVLTWLVLASAAKATFSDFSRISNLLPTFLSLSFMAWIASPFILLAWLFFKVKRNFLQDSALLFASIMLAFFGMGAYGINLSEGGLQDAKVFTWVPLLQLIWAGGWIYALSRRG